ncbi:hypothetical protein AB838_05180 [Rhodobacteraceae bacterium (ex Bugula neritina AB1)]|nr:hypothetical protein AB838_05180 [Rhodobacteraceae bacterium (ex Bugula neritina AB1)]
MLIDYRRRVVHCTARFFFETAAPARRDQFSENASRIAGRAGAFLPHFEPNLTAVGKQTGG